ncbi:MAG: YceI family protein [Maricaulaceae bacterium]|jgi:polyisoprenoid-binding protein YceI
MNHVHANAALRLSRARLVAPLLCAGLAACVTPPSIAPGAAPAGAYRLDPAHASLIWRVGHGEGLSSYAARFDRFDAALDFDPAAPEDARLDVAIEAASVSTGDPDFDAQIAQAVFGAETYPEIRFASTGVAVTGEASAEVTGDLTFRGVTAPVTLDVTYNGGANDPLRRADVIGFSATGAVDRTAFGATAYVNFGVGAEVELQIEAEFLKQ